MIPVPHPPRVMVLFPWMKKVLKGKHFADVEEGKQKNGRSTKRLQNCQVSKTILSSGKKVSIGVSHQMESTLRVTEV